MINVSIFSYQERSYKELCILISFKFITAFFCSKNYLISFFESSLDYSLSLALDCFFQAMSELTLETLYEFIKATPFDLTWPAGIGCVASTSAGISRIF